MKFPLKLIVAFAATHSPFTTTPPQNRSRERQRKDALAGERSAMDATSRNAIRNLLSELQTAWAAGDVNRYALAFSEDAIFVPFNGRRLNGRAAILDFHARPFATEFHGGKLEIDIIYIRALTKGVFLVSTDGGPLRAVETHPNPETQTYVIQDFGDRWAIVFFQNTPVLPPRDH